MRPQLHSKTLSEKIRRGRGENMAEQNRFKVEELTSAMEAEGLEDSSPSAGPFLGSLLLTGHSARPPNSEQGQAAAG